MVSEKAIAGQLLKLTTSVRNAPRECPDWWVTPGCPIVIIEAIQKEGYFEGDAFALVSGMNANNQTKPIAAHSFDHVARRGRWIPVWMLFIDKEAGRDQVRNLRMHLARLHNEREVLGIVLRKCQECELDPEYGPVADYLARQCERLNRFRSEGFPQSSLMYFAHQVDWSVNRDDWADLIEILRSMSPGLSKSVEDAARNAPVSIPGVSGISIEKLIVVYLENGEVAVVVDSGDNVGAKFGDNAQVSQSNFQGLGNQISVQSLSAQDFLSQNAHALAEELSQLREKLRVDAQSTDEDRSVLEVGQARESLQEGDHRGALAHLRRAGKWAMDVATSIGAHLAAAAIKGALGM